MKRALFFALSLSLSLLLGYSLSEAQYRRKGPGKVRERPAPETAATESVTPESTAPATPQPEGGQPAQKAKILENLSDLEAKARAAEKANKWQEASNFYALAAGAARISGQLQKAITYASKGLELGEKAQGPGLQAQALFQLAVAYRLLGQRQKTMELLQRGVEVAKQIPPGVFKEAIEGNLYRELGMELLRDGKIQEAIENISYALQAQESRLSFFENRARGVNPQAIENSKQFVVATLNRLGTAYQRAGNVEEAIKSFERGIHIIKESGLKSPSESNLYQGLGQLYLNQKDYPRALENLQKALELAERAGQVPAIQPASSDIGNVFLQTQRPAEAIPYFKKAIDAIESTRSLLESEELRSSFFEDKGQIYGGIILAHLAAKNVEEAFNYNERARSRAFLDILGSKVQLTRAGTLMEEERALQAKIASLRARSPGEGSDGDSTREERERLRRELEEAQKAYTDFLAKVRKENKEQASLMTVEPLTLKQIQELLDPGVSLLEYFVVRGRAVLWVIERDRVNFVRLSLNRRDLVSKVTSLRESIYQVGEKEKFKQISQELYRVLIEPALPHVRGKELLIIPNDVLHYLPYQALLSPQGRYLVQDYPIYYLSSASLMQFTKEKKRTSRERALVMGNPSLGDQAYDLRFAEREAREIAKIYPKSVLYLRSDATKSKVLSLGSKYDILHFAVHGELKEDDPLNSGLLLASDDGKGDGRLKVSEIFSLNLKADTVVLSACETGLGKITSGDEIIGLTRAFIYAGTPSVITTLWKVNDRAAYELMRQFYSNLKTQKKSEALRQAQLKTMEQFPEPFFWAAYGLTGEP